MSVKDQINNRLLLAMKNGNVAEKSILRVIKGEWTNVENSYEWRKTTGHSPITDDRIYKIIQKLLEGNNETMKLLPPEDPRFKNLQEENEIMKSLLPTQLTKEEVENHLASLLDQIKSAKSEGQAIGVAMKHFKTENLSVDGKIVGEAVKEIRNGCS